MSKEVWISRVTEEQRKWRKYTNIPQQCLTHELISNSQSLKLTRFNYLSKTSVNKCDCGVEQEEGYKCATCLQSSVGQSERKYKTNIKESHFQTNQWMLCWGIPRAVEQCLKHLIMCLCWDCFIIWFVSDTESRQTDKYSDSVHDISGTRHAQLWLMRV